MDQIPATDFLGVSGRTASTMVDHEEAIRNFLSQVDPETGYLE